MIKRFSLWLRATLQRRAMEREMEEELRFHMRAYATDLIRRGMAPHGAELQARREFGSVEQMKDSCRDSRGVGLLESFFADVWYGLRLLRRSRALRAWPS